MIKVLHLNALNIGGAAKAAEGELILLYNQKFNQKFFISKINKILLKFNFKTLFCIR